MINKEAALIDTFKQQKQELENMIRDPSSTLIQKVKLEYQHKLAKAKQELAKKHDKIVFDIQNEKEQLRKKYKELTDKKVEQLKEDLKRSLSNLQEDHIDQIKNRKEMIVLQVQADKEKKANQYKLKIIEARRTSRQKLEQLAEDRQGEIKRQVTQATAKFETELKPQISQLEALKKKALENEKSLKELRTVLQKNAGLSRELDRLNDKLDSFIDSTLLLEKGLSKTKTNLDACEQNLQMSEMFTATLNITDLEHQIKAKKEKLFDLEAEIADLETKKIKQRVKDRTKKHHRATVSVK